MSTSDAIIETEGLSKSFKGFWAVKNVNLSVRRGTIHALIGPNGAGKTTCFNLITKFLQPTAGGIRFNGRDITAMAPADVARLGLVRSFQISATFPHLSLIENVRIALQQPLGTSFHFWKPERTLDVLNERAMALLADVGLEHYADLTAVELPYGRKRALEIATTLALDPEVLLLDEPMAGMGREDIARISSPDPPRGQEPHRAHGRAQPERRGGPVQHHHRTRARDAGRGCLRRSLPQPAGRRGVHGNGRGQHRARGKPSWPAAARLPRRRRRARLLRREPHPARHDVHRPERRGGHAARAQRSRQTTTMRAIMGLLRQRHGSIRYDGTETIRLSPNGIARSGSPIARRSVASFRASASPKTCCCPRS